jgi:hypothetical protein
MAEIRGILYEEKNQNRILPNGVAEKQGSNRA